MPEVSATAAPAAAAPAAAPAQSTPAAPAAGTERVGIDKMMDAFRTPEAPEKPKADTKEHAKADDPSKAPAPDKAAPAKAPAKADDGEVDWDKSPPKLKGAHFKFKREVEAKISSYEKKIADLEAKPKEGVADAKLVEEYQKNLKSLEERLAATDFRNSKDFQKNFVAKWKSEESAALTEVKQLKVKTGEGEDGTPTYRPATDADFFKIMRLPVGEQDEAIAAMFGVAAHRISNRVLRLNGIRSDADAAEAEHVQQSEVKAKEAQALTLKEKGEREQRRQTSRQELVKGWPQFFAPDEKNPEASKALEDGYKFVDDIEANAESMTPADRVDYAEVIRARAAYGVRAVVEMKQLNDKVKSLEEELAKFRKSDPGGGEDGGKGDANAGAGSDEMNIQTMSAKFRE